MAGMELLEQGLKDIPPANLELLIAKGLSPPNVSDAQEAVVLPTIAKARGVQLLRQPFPAIDGDVNVQGEPCLQPQVHKAELRMPQVEVVMLAFAGTAVQLQVPRLGVAVDLVGVARLYRAEHANQPRADPLLLSDLAGLLFFGDLGAVEIDHRSAVDLGQAL